MMYNLQKFDSEKAAKNLNKTYKIQCFRYWCTLCLKNVVEAISTEEQTGSQTLRVTTEGIDKPVFQMTWIAGYITTNGVDAAWKQTKELE